MELVLRSDDGRKDVQFIGNDGSRGFVAGGFDGQNTHGMQYRRGRMKWIE
jgi:hypothetical protein